MLRDDDDPFGSYGLAAITLDDKPTFDLLFSSCHTRLSDYTFANTFIWRDSIHLRWKFLRDCLCVFANGDGGLTMLFPPLGPRNGAAALREALEICEAYNARAGLKHWTRVEYVSRELLEGLTGGGESLRCHVEPMSGDYVYRTASMIELAGGDLASKRQARNRFARRYAARTEDLGPQHIEPCLDLLATWQEQSQASEANTTGPLPAQLRASVQLKKSKEVAAAADTLYNARALGLRGMVLYAGDNSGDERIVGFTLGEMLDSQTCSIVIEKTDRNYVGSAQYIFSEFCRQYWSHATWCNVGDDWEVPSLAWTKQSYRPAMRLEKFVLRPTAAVSVVMGGAPAAPCASVPEVAQAHEPELRQADLPEQLAMELHSEESPTVLAGAGQGPDLSLAGPNDLDDLLALELKCFSNSVAVSRRQMRYLLRAPSASVHVLRQGGHVIAAALLLRRRHSRGVSGRLYSIAVDASCQGKGYGRLLLENCLAVLRNQNVQAVTLEVDVSNQSAISLYESAGFVKTRRLSDHYAPGKDAWKMRLKLTAAVAPAPELLPLLPGYAVEVHH